MLRFVGAAQSPAAPTNAARIKGCSPPLSPRVTHSYPRKKAWEALASPKNYSTKGEGFCLNSFGGEVVEGKKMLFQIFFEVLIVG